MVKIKLVGWAVGISVFTGALSIPVLSTPVNDSATGTNIFNSPAVVYGNEPLIKTEVLAKAIQVNKDTINALLEDNSTSASLTIPLGLVPDTERGILAYAKKLDRQVQDRATCVSQHSIAEKCQARATNAEISEKTREYLSQLLTQLNDIERGLWAYGDTLDQSIRDSAKGLSQDITAAEASCKTNPLECKQLNSLANKTDAFVKGLEELRGALTKSGQKARIY